MILYIFAFLLAVAALTLLVVFSALKGSPSMVVGFSLYGASLVLFYLVRGIYVHTHEGSSFKAALFRLDHVMIYLLTAATYTPVALMLPERGWGWSIFGVVWGIFLLGSLLRITERVDKKWTTAFVYIAFLTLDIVAFSVVHEFLTPGAVFWLSLGGAAYITETLLVVYRPAFLRLKAHHYEALALPFMLFGSFAHFWAMIKHLIIP